MFAEVVDEAHLVKERNFEAEARFELRVEFLEAVKHHGVLLSHNDTKAQVIVGVCTADRAVAKVTGKETARLISEAHSWLDDDIMLS